MAITDGSPQIEGGTDNTIIGNVLDQLKTVDVVSTIVNLNFTVGTTQVEAKVGSNRLANRKMLYIENTGNTSIFYGPTGVTASGSTRGAELRKREFVFIPASDLGIFVISSAASGQVTVQEFS
jgi:hypothetical protein